MNAGRLQFFFQYANTAGAWFAAMALLASSSDKVRIRQLSFLPTLSLLLTQSAGAIALYLVGMTVLAIALLKREKHHEIAQQLASFVGAALALMVDQLIGGVALLTVAALLATLFLSETIDNFIERLSSRPKAMLALTCAAAIATPIVALAIFPQRLAQASQTFIERYIQIVDGFTALSNSPIFGIGPDMWQHVFPFVQSAQYQAGSIHCGYLQIALDSGIVGLVAFLAFVGIGLYRLTKSGSFERLIATSLLLAHALIDFDFQFASVFVTLILLMYSGIGRPAGKTVAKVFSKSENKREENSAALDRRSAQKYACVALAALALTASLLGAACDFLKDHACKTVDPSIAVTAESGSFVRTLLSNDVDILTAQYALLLQEVDYEEVIRLYEHSGAFGAEQAAFVALSMMAQGDLMQASDILIDNLEKQPYNTALFEMVAELFATYGINPSAESRYHEVVNRANQLAKQGNAALLSNQVDMAVFDGN